jgi:hypothetical protein
MYSSPLLSGVPLMGGSFTIEEGERKIGAEEASNIALASERRRGRERGAETGKGDRRGVPAEEFWV